MDDISLETIKCLESTIKLKEQTIEACEKTIKCQQTHIDLLKETISNKDKLLVLYNSYFE